MVMGNVSNGICSLRHTAVSVYEGTEFACGIPDHKARP